MAPAIPGIDGGGGITGYTGAINLEVTLTLLKVTSCVVIVNTVDYFLAQIHAHDSLKLVDTKRIREA